MCEECESFHDRSRQADVVMGQSIVLSEIKTGVPLENDIPSHQNLHCNDVKRGFKVFHRLTE